MNIPKQARQVMSLIEVLFLMAPVDNGTILIVIHLLFFFVCVVQRDHDVVIFVLLIRLLITWRGKQTDRQSEVRKGRAEQTGRIVETERHRCMYIQT